MLASFSIVPVGIGEGLKQYVAEIMKIVDASGLEYAFGSMQTTVEGNEEDVMALILKCHRRIREMAPRVLTHIAIDDREGASGRIKGKTSEVEDVLRKNLNRE